MFKREGGGSKAFWTMFKKTALFSRDGFPNGDDDGDVHSFLWRHECNDDDVFRDDESDAAGEDFDFWCLRRRCGQMELKMILMAMTMVPMEMMIAVKCNLQCNVAVFHSCSSGPANWGSGQLCNNSPHLHHCHHHHYHHHHHRHHHHHHHHHCHCHYRTTMAMMIVVVEVGEWGWSWFCWW